MSMNLDKLAQVLAELAGYKRQALISKEIFEKCLFSSCKTASKYLWLHYANYDTDAKTISVDSFVSHCEKIVATVADKDQIQLYLKMFSGGKEMMDQSSFMNFLASAYVLYRSVNKLGDEDDSDTSSPTALPWLETVYKSAYQIKSEMSICFMTNWILTNIPRLVGPMHKFIVNQLLTSHNQLKSGNKSPNMISKNTSPPEGNDASGSKNEDSCSKLIHPILMWLLRSSLPPKYLTIMEKKPDSSLAQKSAPTSPEKWMQMLTLRDSESWTLLYDSDDQGMSVNRFQHHVFNYRGPTLMFVKADNDYLFCIASDIEWRESCHFWGGEDSLLLMLKPEFKVVERGSKLLYVNFSIRGYPFGIQIGKNPRSLSIEIKPEFNYVSYKQIPCKLIRFLAWGCAPPEVKLSQSDLRKWEEKQAEKNKKINLNNPEWTDNPDKYLLELAGSYKSYDNQ